MLGAFWGVSKRGGAGDIGLRGVEFIRGAGDTDARADVYMSANSTSCFNPVGDRSRINKASSRGQTCKYCSIIVN